MVVKYVLYMPHACRVTHDETMLMHAHMGGEELGLVHLDLASFPGAEEGPGNETKTGLYGILILLW